MKEIFFKYLNLSICSSLIFMIFGLLLFLSPESIIVTISCIIGLFLIIYGIFKLISYYKNNINNFDLVFGLISIISGIMLISNTNILATIIPTIIGLYMIIIGVKKIEISLNVKNNNISGWSYLFLMALLSLSCGLFLIINPIKGAFIATKIIGLIIIIYSIISIIDSIFLKRNIKKISKVIKS